MVKRTIWMLGGALLVAGLIFGHEAKSYLKTGAQRLKQSVKAEIPLEFELDRARQLTTELMPEIRQAMHVVAEQQVECERMTADLARRESELNKQKETILSIRSELNSQIKPAGLVIGRRKYTAEEVNRDLSLRFDRYQAAETNLAADKRILQARERSLAADREKLDKLLHSRKELEVNLEQLEARLRTLQAAEAVSSVAIDDSRFQQTHKLLSDLNKQLDVRERVLDAEGKFTNLIPIEEAIATTDEALTARIDAHFGKNEPQSVATSRE